jgi:hypothetical protein
MRDDDDGAIGMAHRVHAGSDQLQSRRCRGPESVSSRIASLGSSSAIWKISLRFFSPPENPSFTARTQHALIDVEQLRLFLDAAA